MIGSHPMPSEQEQRQAIQTEYGPKQPDYRQAYLGSPLRTIISTAENQQLVNIIIQSGLLKGKVLEVGCGDGQLAELFPRLDLIGLDVTYSKLKDIDPQLNQGNYLQADLENPLPFSSNSIDTIAGIYGPCSYLLHIDQFLTEASRVLSPGGSIILGFYSWRHGQNTELGGYSTTVNSAAKITFYTQQQIHDLVSLYFTDVKVYGINYTVNVLHHLFPDKPETDYTLEEINNLFEIERQHFAKTNAGLARYVLATGTNPQ
jgi:SAM-dependent methyltransferase